MHPLVSTILFVAAFVGLTYLVFSKIQYPEYTFSLIGVLLIAFVSTTTQRIRFIQRCYPSNVFYQIRTLENVGLAIPFAAVLSYQNEILLAIMILSVSFILVFLPFQTVINTTIPSPFGRLPFEFTRGFRRFFVLYFTTYILTYFACESSNFNLAGFYLIITFLISANFYSYAEPLYYLWICKHNPKQFLIHKLKTILIYSLLPALPIVVSMIIYFPSYFWITIALLLIGHLYVQLFMLAKYASYPYEMSITDGFIIAGSILFPPALVFVMPLFYIRSVKSLNNLLRD